MIPGPTPDVPINTAITAAFTEAMDSSTLTGSTFTLTGPANATVAGVVTYNASHTAIFTPSAGLAASTTYTATITTGARNVSGDQLAGNQGVPPAASNYVWSFTTGLIADTTPPQVTLTSPVTTIPGPTTGAAITSAITASFTEPMNPATLTTDSFTLKGPGGSAVSGSVAYAATDVAGNALAGNLATPPTASNYVWTFTTSLAADTTKPRVTLTVPATTTPGPTTGVSTLTAITATFTKAMDPSTITVASFTVTTPLPGTNPLGTVSYAANSQTAVFTPVSELAADTTYTVTITTAVKDLAGNALAGNLASLPAASNYVWTFTTSSSVVPTPPTIVLTVPAQLATGVVLNGTINATFSEAMNPTTLTTVTFTVQASGTPLGSPLAGAVTYDPASLIATFTPTSNLAPNTSYTATVTGAKSLTGDALHSGLVPNPWSFTTGSSGVAPGAVNLGTASTFGIMATSAITSTGLTVINGDVSLDPGTSMTGFPPGVVNGAIHINDSVSAQARIDLLASYNAAKGLAPGTTISAGADLGALYPLGCPPGTYTSGSTMLVSTPLVLDGGGDANAVWVFQIGSSFTTGNSVSLTNGAQAKNVFWVPTFDGTIGVGTIFYGTIIAGRSVTGVTGSTINGRILAGATTAGTIALQSTTVNVPAQ
jgi:hypothetical protein